MTRGRGISGVFQKRLKPLPWPLLLVFLLLAVSISISGYFFYKKQKTDIYREQTANLRVIADLKANEISRWLQERVSNARLISENQILTVELLAFLRDRFTGPRQELIRNWMESLRNNYHYQNVLLLDGSGEVALALAKTQAAVGPKGLELMAAVRRRKEVLISDLHISEKVPLLHFDVVAPLTAGSAVNGFVVLRIDPAKFLFPLIQSWPTSSPSAETLLVRREGDTVLYLNELRHRKNTAMKLRFPISNTELPAVQVVMGKTGMLSGRDYRGVAVWLVFRPVPDSPWFIEAKIDREEIERPIRRSALVIFLVIFSLALAAALLILYMWQRQNTRFRLRQLEAESQRQVLVQHFDYLTRYANDIILLCDEKGNILEANERAVVTYGYGREALLLMNIRDLHVPGEQDKLVGQVRQAEEWQGLLFETAHQKKDGVAFPVEVSARVIAVDDKKYFQSIVRDITERKRAELQREAALVALRESEERFRAQYHGSPIPAFTWQKKGESFVLENYNASAEKITHGLVKEFVGKSASDMYGNRPDIIQTFHQCFHEKGIISLETSSEHFIPDKQVISTFAFIPPDLVMVHLEDVTERKQAEEALRESEVRFRELFNRMSSGVAVYEAVDNGGDFIFRDFNLAAEKIEKVSRKDILGKRVSEVFPGVKAFGVFEVFQRVWQTGKPEYYPENIYKDERDSGSWRESWVFKLPSAEIVAIYNDVTERKRAESQREVALEALEKSSQLLGATGEMAKVGGWELDLSTQEVSWTEEVYRIHGVEPGYKPKLEEAVNFYVPESRPVLEAALKKTAETGEPFDLESLFIPQGSKDKIWVRSIGRAVYNDGKITKLAGIFQNIDKYKRVEEALRESEGIFNQFLTASPVLVYVKNEKHRFYKLSKSFEDLFGKPTSELIGKDLYDLLPPELAKIVFEDDLKVLKGSISVNAEEKLNDKVFSSIKFPIHRESGKPDYLGGFSVDITEHKRAESQKEAALEALRQAEENFRRSLDESPLGVRIVTAKGKTIYANRTLLDFYNYDSVAELNHMTIRQRYTPESYEEYKKRRKARERGRLGPREYEVGIVRKDGDVRQLQVFRKAIIWNGAKQFQALYRDISESKQWLEKFSEFEQTIQGQKMLLDQQTASVEELIERLTRSREELGASYRELKAKKDDLVRSEKLAFTGRIAAGIAHEIRNPLTNVILSLRQLKKGEKIKPEILKYAEIMERNTSRIEYLITELLNCARPLKLNLQPGDIHLLIQDILNVHNVRLKTQKIKVLQNLTSQPSILLFDKEQLGRVFLNLIANAIDAMRKGGKLSIATKSEKKKFLIKIQDSGCGIPKKNLIKVFDPFFSTKKGGAGLGLSICQNIVVSHSGLIEVESAWRKGSVFSVSLPFEPKPLDRKKNMAGEP